MKRRWLLPTLTAAAATVAVIGGAVVLTTGNDTREASSPAAQQPTTGGDEQGQADGAATGEPSEAPGDDTASEVSAAVPVYFVGDTAQGPRLYREFQRQQVCASEACKPEAAVRTAVAGTPDDPDYRTSWPAGTTVNGVRWDGRELTVDLGGTHLHDRPAGMSQSEATLALQQVIYSAQAARGEGRPPVRLLLDGAPAERVLGVPASDPFSAASADSTLATIWVTAPAQGATVPSGFEVSGQAATFEANVAWELEQDGRVVRRGFTTAGECCTLSPYSFTVKAPPGQYTLRVHDTDESDGEGVGTSEDTKDITVR